MTTIPGLQADARIADICRERNLLIEPGDHAKAPLEDGTPARLSPLASGGVPWTRQLPI